jgi:hypothetical protein
MTQKITETPCPSPGGWVITAHQHGDKLYELERENDGDPWQCPECKKTGAGLFDIEENEVN